MVWEHFTAVGNQQWDNNLLQAIISKYNNKTHSSLSTSPLKASTGEVIVEPVLASALPQTARASSE